MSLLAGEADAHVPGVHDRRQRCGLRASTCSDGRHIGGSDGVTMWRGGRGVRHLVVNAAPGMQSAPSAGEEARLLRKYNAGRQRVPTMFCSEAPPRALRRRNCSAGARCSRDENTGGANGNNHPGNDAPRHLTQTSGGNWGATFLPGVSRPISSGCRARVCCVYVSRVAC